MTTPPGDGWVPPGQPWSAPPPHASQDHPRATTALVLGIVGLVTCQVLSPFAWSIGKKAVTEIDASGGYLGGRGQAQAGMILGIIGTVLLALGVAFLLLYFVIVVLLLGASVVGS